MTNLVEEINKLKAEKGAVILAHNYQAPEIFYTVADFVGDSLQIAQQATKTDAKIIVQAGVHFMAETSKILCPDKTVLIPDMRAGCSLAESITGADVRLLKAWNPGYPVVTYVNTSAEVKAESDICCTSANARRVVEWIAKEWNVSKVIMIPDEFLAKNVQKELKAAGSPIDIIYYHGKCMVHEQFDAEDIKKYRELYPDVIVLAHPECPPSVVAASDFAGSTSSMIHYVKQKADVQNPPRIVMLTECSMNDNVRMSVPGIRMETPCKICPHMKRITLQGILESLQKMQYEVLVDPSIATRARAAVEMMLKVPVSNLRTTL
jgi:quinolinate synthase